jgi:hypothetical protein
MQIGFAEGIGAKAKAGSGLVKIGCQDSAQVPMGDSVASAIGRKMKTLHPFPFLLIEYFDVRRQIQGGGL